MTELKLFNSKENATEERITADVIMRGYENPEELMLKTIEAAKQREKENAAKNALKKKVYMRVAAVAALIILVLAGTPAGGYVVSAAESAWQAFQAWMNDVFSVSMKKTVDGCTFEIIEARVSNEFLYVTVEEDYESIEKKHEDCFISVAYVSGRLYNNDGYSCEISNDFTRVVGNYETTVVTKPNKNAVWEKEDEGTACISGPNVKTYRIYIPDMKKVINDKKKKYYCDITFSPKWIGYDEYDYYIPANNIGNKIGDFPFTFQIKNVDAVISSEVHSLNYSYTLKDMKFDFKKMIIGKNESNIIVEITPLHQLAEYDLINDGDLNIRAEISKCDSTTTEEYPVSENINFMYDGDYFGLHSKFNTIHSGYWIFIDYSPNVGIVYNGTEFVDEDSFWGHNSTKETHSVIEPNGTTDFRIISLAYSFQEYVKDNDETLIGYHVSEEADIRSTNYHSFWDQADVKTQKYKFKELKLNGKWTNKAKIADDQVLDFDSLSEIKDSNLVYHFYKQIEINQSADLARGKLQLTHLESNIKSGTVKKSDKRDTSRPEIQYTRSYVNDPDIGLSVLRIDDDSRVGTNDGYSLDIVRFVLKKKNKIISELSLEEHIYEHENDFHQYMFNTITETEPDTILPVYAEWSSIDNENDKYIYYNPDYCNQYGLSKDEHSQKIKEERRNKDLKAHGTFTVSEENLINP